MRIEWDLTSFVIPKDKINDYFNTLIGATYKMKWSLKFTERKPRMVLFVSKASHCLYDILQRYGTGEYNCEIPAIISNHEQLRIIVPSTAALNSSAQRAITLPQTWTKAPSSRKT